MPCIEKGVYESVKEVQKEIAEMCPDEYKSFLKDIEDYEKEHGNITIHDDEKP